MEINLKVDLNDATITSALSDFFLALAIKNTEREGQSQTGLKVETKVEPVKVETKVEPAKKPKVKEPEKKQPEQEQPEKKPEKTKEKPNSNEITLLEIKEIVGKKTKESNNGAANKEAIKAKLEEWGVPNIPKLDKEHYPELVEFVNRLK